MPCLLFPLLFLACAPVLAAPDTAPAPALQCLALQPPQGEPDGWLLLAALVVCTAGRLAQPRKARAPCGRSGDK